MTSTQSMLTRRARSASRALAVTLGLLSAVLALAGCRGSSAPRLTPPMVNESPYDPAAGDVLWAVVPLRNESGTSLADPLILSDKVVSAVAEARGLRCLPLNRTLATMRALELPAIRTPAEAQALARALGADGVLVGSITAYDPYVPTIGLTIALHGRPGAMNASPDRTLDARALTGRTDEPASQAEGNFSSRPLSVAAEHYDGKNHQVLLDVQAYANGRSDPTSSLGWRRYVASMDLYQEFAAHRVLSALLDHERRRIGTPAGSAQRQ